MSLFIPFVTATKLMQPEFERALEILPNAVNCIISDGFFPWTQDSASKLGLPRRVFYGMSNYATTLYTICTDPDFISTNSDDDEPFLVPNFPSIKLTMNDFEPEFSHPEPGPHTDFYTEVAVTTANSKGMIVNSFYELEPEFVDYWNREAAPKAWSVGPLCLSHQPPPPPNKVHQHVAPHEKPIWRQWLDEMLGKGRSVLYVAFGTQEEFTTEQLREIAVGLERSNSNFLWVIKGEEFVDDGFEERVKGRGLVVREWVDQVKVLSHECVDGFMSHCRWNSVMESVCASVPILGFPITADQHVNTRMVVEYLGIGVRVLGRNGSVRGYVSAESVEKMVRELMEGEKGKELRKKVKEISEMGRSAMEEGGSSWLTLNLLIDEVCGKKK